jgi:diguanylate cyclase (GGDEF)-like protein
MVWWEKSMVFLDRFDGAPRYNMAGPVRAVGWSPAMQPQGHQIILLTPDNYWAGRVRAQLTPSHGVARLRQVKAPSDVANGGHLQDWLVVDVEAFGGEVCNDPAVRGWPGHRLLMCPDQFQPPFACAVCRRDQAASRLLGLLGGGLPSAVEPPRRRVRPAPLQKRGQLASGRVLTLAADLARLSREQFAEACVERIPPALGMRLASYYRFDGKARCLLLQRCNHPYKINELVDLGQNPNQPMAWAVRQGQPCLVRDWSLVGQKGDGEPERPFADRYSTRTCVVIPLQPSGRLAGVLNLADPVDDEAVAARRVDAILEPLVAVLTTALANIELFEQAQQQARTDALTGLGNYRAFAEQLRKEVMRSRRYGPPLSLMLLDVDGLKHVNDGYGHPAGDRLLQTIAGRIVGAVRETDVPSRCGGDEFAVILPNTSLEAARQVAQRVLHVIGHEPIPWQDQPLAASISVGVGQYQGQLTSDEFIRSIDRALHSAKVGGKNQMAVSAADQTAAPAQS